MAKIRLNITFLCFIASLMLKAQFGELGKFDCTYAKEILIPFNYSEDTTIKIQPLLQQKVFYSFRDQFTFWYKVVVKSDKTLSYKVKALNDSDSYSVYVYNYNGKSFCNDVFYQKILPEKSTFFIGKNQADSKDQNQKSFYAKSNNTYYIGVLNTSVNNCGHQFVLTCDGDTAKIDALHLPCKTETASLNIKQLKPIIVKKDSVIQPKVVIKPDTVLKPIVEIKRDSITPVAVKTERITPQAVDVKYNLKLSVLSAKNKKPVDSKLLIIDKSQNTEIQMNESGKGIFNFVLEAGKIYSVKANALGYEQKIIEINADILINQYKKSEEILLEPVKQGHNFVLKSIYFVPNTYALKKESLEEMEKLLSFLKNNEETVIEIQGHTNGDNRIVKNSLYSNLGEEWNFSGSSKKLSQKRAEVIKLFLMNNGISETRLIAKGYGGQKYLIKDPETNSEAQKNIRVEVMVIKN